MILFMAKGEKGSRIKAITHRIGHFRHAASGRDAGLVIIAPTGVFLPTASSTHFIQKNGDKP